MSEKKIRFLITGAGFTNSGAQAMMFLTVSEIKKRFRNCHITVINSAKLPKLYTKCLEFEYVECGSGEYYAIAKVFNRVKMQIKNIAKKKIKKESIKLNVFEEHVKDADYVIDISGYALSSQWPDINCLQFLARIETARKYNVPIYLMPQSFGPFNFSGKNSKEILKKIQQDMKYPTIIFAREKEGYYLLTEKYHLNNVHFSSDMVLQGNIDNINMVLKDNYVEHNNFETLLIGIGIIPNQHCYHENKTKLIFIYENIVRQLRDSNEIVYIVRHSEADLAICQEIKKKFESDKDVVLINKLLNSIEFSELARCFKFAIASRYHSIVHLYKNIVPCIAIGWATKYTELLKLFDQESHVFDIRKIEDISMLLKDVRNMQLNIEKEKSCIKKRLRELNKSTCFDTLFSDINEK